MKKHSKRYLIISAHADDEILGMGGTIARLSKVESIELHWLIVTKIWAPKWTEDKISNRKEAIQSIVRQTKLRAPIVWEYRDNCLDQYPINELQEKLIEVLDLIKPNVVYLPSPWDFNFEHRLVFDLVEMSTKAYYSPYIEEIIAYEIPSSSDAAFATYRSFLPNMYINVEDEISEKIKLINAYETEMHDFPHPRSEEYVKALAQKRGGEAGLKYAEAFHLLRRIER